LSKRTVTFTHIAAPLPDPGAKVKGADSDTKSPPFAVAGATRYAQSHTIQNSNLPVPSTVDRDTTASVATVASNGIVVMVTHTVNILSISETSIDIGTVNDAAARIRKSSRW
jgi:hypothetical protein